MIMLVEDLPAYIMGTVPGYGDNSPSHHYHLTINKDDNQQWSAGYMHYDTGRIILAINNADTLEEVAVRLNGRIDRYARMNPPKPRLLRGTQKSSTVVSANVTMEGTAMPDTTDQLKDNAEDKAAEGTAQEPTHGQKLVGINFNPGGDPRVTKLKELAAAQIDLLEELHNEQYPPKPDGGFQGAYDVNLLQGHAIRHVIDAQMACVKRATWPVPTTADTANEAGGAK